MTLKECELDSRISEKPGISSYSQFCCFPLGFSQGIRRAVGGLATIMGPLWAGSTVEMGYVMFGVMTFLFAFILVSI